jgi:hypothetical protein
VGSRHPDPPIGTLSPVGNGSARFHPRRPTCGSLRRLSVNGERFCADCLEPFGRPVEELARFGGVPRTVARDAASLGRAWRRAFPRSRLSEDLRLACVVIASRRRGIPLSLRELASRVSVDHNKIATACKSIGGHLSNLGFQVPRIPVQELETYIRARAEGVPSVEELAAGFRVPPEAIRRVLARAGVSAKAPSMVSMDTTKPGPPARSPVTISVEVRDDRADSSALTPDNPTA